jgi:hypothetical protein
MRWLVLAIVGALLCTVGDHFHATQGVLVYRQIFAWSQAYWIPPLFALASIVCVASARMFLSRDAAVPSPRLIVGDALGFSGGYLYTSFAAPEHPNVTLLVLVVAFIVRVLGERRPAATVVYCVLLGIGGVVGECLISSTGGFHYVHPDVLMTPRWLGGIYLHVGLLTSDLAARYFRR